MILSSSSSDSLLDVSISELDKLFSQSSEPESRSENKSVVELSQLSPSSVVYAIFG